MGLLEENLKITKTGVIGWRSWASRRGIFARIKCYRTHRSQVRLVTGMFRTPVSQSPSSPLCSVAFARPLKFRTRPSGMDQRALLSSRGNSIRATRKSSISSLSDTPRVRSYLLVQVGVWSQARNWPNNSAAQLCDRCRTENPMRVGVRSGVARRDTTFSVEHVPDRLPRGLCRRQRHSNRKRFGERHRGRVSHDAWAAAFSGDLYRQITSRRDYMAERQRCKTGRH